MNNVSNRKVVIVTGAGSWIGEEIALSFAREGAIVNLVGRTQEKLERVLGKIEKMGEQGIVFPANVCDEQEISTMVEKVTEEYKRIDVLVHCAAIYPQAPISSLTLNEWKEVIEVNLTGTFVVLKACAAVMKRFQSGRVILISSVAGETVGLPHYSHYASSKAGMNGLMRTAALELAKYNIMVNSISPGNILNQSAYPVGEERVEAMLKRIPLGRLGNPRDIAEIALFLGSDKASFITGQSIVVDGGQSILPGIL